MRKAFASLAILLMLVVLAEFYFAASGGFSTTPRAEAYRPHHALGYVVFLLPLVMALIVALGRMPRRLIGLAIPAVAWAIVRHALPLSGWFGRGTVPSRGHRSTAGNAS